MNMQYSTDEQVEALRWAQAMAEQHALGRHEAILRHVQAQVSADGADVASAKQRLAECKSTLAAFKEQVRAKAIEVAREQNWCTRGLNDALRELGLPPAKTKVTGTVNVTERALRYGYIDVEAEVEDPDDIGAVNTLLREIAEDMLENGDGQMGEWEDFEPEDSHTWSVDYEEAD